MMESRDFLIFLADTIDREYAFEKAMGLHDYYKMQEGIEAGEKHKEREMVVKFYNQGVSIDIISKASGLSKEKVEEIIKND